VRLFVAVVPPADVLDQVAEVSSTIPDRAGLRRTSRDQWHVTVRFLGEVDDAAPVAEALDGAGVGPTEAVLGPAVQLLARKVLCLPVSGLDALATGIVAATADLGTPPDDRPFRGHLTLARLKPRTRPREVRGVVGTPVAARWPVTEVELVRSHLSSTGPRYETLHVRALE
jgi:2'-5' RNA ligase